MSKKSEKDKANDYDAHLDKTLIDGASDSNYMYSIADTHAILLKLRQKYLNYEGIQEANPGEAYSYLRENNNQVLLLNSYVLQDLRNGLADDISKITEGGQGVAVWNHPPQTILVPFLTAAHWILMKVDIDYVECKASLLWDNPYGSSYEVGEYVLNGVSITSLDIIRYVHAFVERIIQHYSHDPSFVLQENDWVLNYQHMDQQGFQRDGVSCGIITLRNIEDYLDARINHGKSVPEEYTIPSYFDNLKINREKLLQAKEAHVTYFAEISGEKANNGEVRVFSEISGTSIKDFLDVDKVISEIENLRVSYNRTNPMITKDIGAQNKSKDLDYTQKAQGYSLATREIGLNAIYNETQILKIWDNYVNKLQLKYFFNNVAQAKSIFSITNSMDVINSGGILVYENGSLFINANRNSVSICRSVDYISSFAKMYGYNSITHNIENVLEQIKAWNTFNSQNSIYSHTIIFPYHITLGHWRLGVLELNFDKTLGLIETRVNVYNPLTNYSNQQMVDSVKKDVQDSINKIFKTNIELIIRDIVTYQQQDSSSCGVISAENGKDIIDGKQERIYKIYSPDTSNLRFQHLSEVDDIYFNKMQLVPVKWQIPTLISPDVILEIQNLCMQELLKGNHFSLNVALAKLDKVNDVKKKVELFHEILEKNKYLFEEIAIRELKYQFYYDDSSSEDEESSGFDSYNYYQIENGVSDAYHSISEYTAESNTKALSERDIELSFITHEIGIRVIKSPEVGEKYFPLKHKYLGSNIIPEKNILKSFIQEILENNLREMAINPDTRRECIAKVVEDLITNPRKIFKNVSSEDTYNPFPYSRYLGLPTTKTTITSEIVLNELRAIHTDFSQMGKTITRKENKKDTYKVVSHKDIYNYKPKNEVQEILKERVLKLDKKITVQGFINSLLTDDTTLRLLQDALDPIHIKFNLDVQHSIYEGLKKFNQDNNITRPTLPKSWFHELNDGWETPIDLLSIGRLMSTSVKRAYKNSQDVSSILGSNKVSFTRQIKLLEAEVIEIQELYKSGARSDKVIIETQGNSVSYDAIAMTIENIKKNLKVSDANIAKWIRDILNGQKHYAENSIYTFTLHPTEEKEIVEFIGALTYLLFHTEVFRNPSSLIIHQMVLDLIIDGEEELTFAKAFDYMSMSQKRIEKPSIGAVDVSRLLSNFYKTSMKYFYDKATVSPIQSQEAADYLKSFINNEINIIEKWLLSKSKIENESTSDYYYIENYEVYHYAKDNKLVTKLNNISLTDYYIMKLCYSLQEWWNVEIKENLFIIDKILLDFELDEIDGIENLSLKDLDNLIKAGEDNSEEILILLDENLDISKILELYNQGAIKTIAKDGVRLAQLEGVWGLEEIIEIYNKDKTLYKRLVKDPDELIEKYGFEGAKERIEETSNRHQERRECPGYEPGDSYGEEDSYDEACYVSPLYRYSSDDSQNIHTSGSSDENNDGDY